MRLWSLPFETQIIERYKRREASVIKESLVQDIGSCYRQRTTLILGNS